MKQFTQRQKIVGGVFSIVTVVWSIDMLSGGPVPDQASAAPPPTLITNDVGLPPAPENIDSIIEALNQRHTTREPLPFAQLKRDIFTPTEALKAGTAPELPNTDALAEAAALEAEQAPEASFESLHSLQGVINGRTPLALIDGRLAPVGAEIDGYLLVEIECDAVTLEKDGRRVTLRVIAAEPRRE